LFRAATNLPREPAQQQQAVSANDVLALLRALVRPSPEELSVVRYLNICG